LTTQLTLHLIQLTPPGSLAWPCCFSPSSDQMDAAAADAIAAFIIVFTLFVVAVLPINSFVCK
jgi:hypothetical protein